MLRRFLIFFSLFAGLSWATAALAQTGPVIPIDGGGELGPDDGLTAGGGFGSDGLSVGVEVLPECELVTSDVDFGTIGSNAANVSRAFSIKVICDPEAGFSLGLDAGRHVSSSPIRRLRHNDNQKSAIAYKIEELTVSGAPIGTKGLINLPPGAVRFDDATTVFGVGEQTFELRATLLMDDSETDNVLPAGRYSDVVLVVLEF